MKNKKMLISIIVSVGILILIAATTAIIMVSKNRNNHRENVNKKEEVHVRNNTEWPTEEMTSSENPTEPLTEPVTESVTEQETEKSTEQTTEPVNVDYAKIEALAFESHEQLAEYAENKNYNYIYDTNLDNMADGNSIAGNSDEAEGSSYSITNVRTEGIDEADCIKTDGKYIYIADSSNNELIIMEANGKNTKCVYREFVKKLITDYYQSSWTEIEFKSMFLHENKIALLGNARIGENYSDTDTLIAILDAKDKTGIKLEKFFTVSGIYEQSRLVDNNIYVFTKKMLYDKKNIIPFVDGVEMSAGEMYDSCCNFYSSNIIMTSYDLSSESRLVDKKSVVGGNSNNIYVTENNIYSIFTDYADTKIIKFSYKDGVFVKENAAKVKGFIEDIFSIDEYNGYLRILTTSYTSDWLTSNALYVLDNELNLAGKISNIAPDEEIYSARFDGDIGYFVTYKEVDPLFSVDLSNPNNPEIIGALKIPGFSEYMHFWQDGRLFGIGKEGGVVKLSMFNTEDPTNVTEESKKLIDKLVYSNAFYNHKAVFIDSDKNLIGFLGDHSSQNSIYNIFSYENGEFVNKQQILMPYNDEGDVRGMYIGEYIYVVSQSGTVCVITIDGNSIIDTIYYWE